MALPWKEMIGEGTQQAADKGGEIVGPYFVLLIIFSLIVGIIKGLTKKR